MPLPACPATSPRYYLFLAQRRASDQPIPRPACTVSPSNASIWPAPCWATTWTPSSPTAPSCPPTTSSPAPDEPGHVAYALGEYYRATGETTLKGHDLIDLAARCVTAQMFTEPPAENGLAYAALGLLCFGPSKERNPVWERLVEETQQRIDKQLLHRSDYDNHWQAFNIAKAVARFSFGLSKKDETSRLIERMVDRINQTSSAGFFDDSVHGLGGNFNLYGVIDLRLHPLGPAAARQQRRARPQAADPAHLRREVHPDDARPGPGRRAGLGLRPRRRRLRPDALHQPDPSGPARRLDPRRPEAEVLRHPAPALPVLLPDLPRPGAGLPRPARRRAHRLQASTPRAWPTSTPRATSASGPAWPTTVQMPVGAARSSSRRAPAAASSSSTRATARSRASSSTGTPRAGCTLQIPLDQLRRPPLERRRCPSPTAPGVFDWPNNVYLPIMLPELTFGEHVRCPPSTARTASPASACATASFSATSSPS